MLSSVVCRYEHFFQPWYLRWAARMQLEPAGDIYQEDRSITRKAWEWCAIAQALEERGMLREGKTGLGFAVGTEPLASVFAASGVNVTGTDLATDEWGWSTFGEHAKSAAHMYHPALVDKAVFDQKAKFETADMTKLEEMPSEGWDFLWSSCSFEHLGSLQAGFDFVTGAMRLLKPGGVAIHTTEFNVNSNKQTLDSGGSVIYRRQDIERLEFLVRGHSAAMERVDYFAGAHRHDIEYDYPPYFKHGRKHVKLLLGPYVSTSILLIFRKGAVAPV